LSNLINDYIKTGKFDLALSLIDEFKIKNLSIENRMIFDFYESEALINIGKYQESIEILKNYNKKNSTE
jgi:hypothetical protein